MNQPKFKFGDKVKVINSALVFEIDAIRANGGDYFYFPNDYLCEGRRESEIELYQEPQKKKLYAYSNCSRVKFLKIECLSIGGGLELYKRDPDYDIEYPETK